MKCPACGFDNQKNINVCEECGSDLHAQPVKRPSEPALPPTEPVYRRRNRPLSLIGRLVSALFSFLIYVIFLILIIAAILAILIVQCRLNIPIPPDWDFLPPIVINYWNWADEWQMGRCPDLSEGNYIFGDEPLPRFDEGGEVVPTESACAGVSIIFSPSSAPAGSSFDIALDGYVPDETIRACWYFPSGKLVNCADLEADGNGHRDTVYWSGISEAKGSYRMETTSECGDVHVEWTVE